MLILFVERHSCPFSLCICYTFPQSCSLHLLLKTGVYNTFLQRARSKYFRLCRLYSLSHNYSNLFLLCKGNLRQYVNECHGCVLANFYLQQQVMVEGEGEEWAGLAHGLHSADPCSRPLQLNSPSTCLTAHFLAIILSN